MIDQKQKAKQKLADEAEKTSITAKSKEPKAASSANCAGDPKSTQVTAQKAGSNAGQVTPY